MRKKLLFYFVVFSMMLSSFAVIPFASADSKVCGVDNVTYDNAAAAEAVGTDVSYEFACTTVTSEANLYEAKSDVHFVGMLIEIGSTDLPTTIIVRDNKTNQDSTINVTANTLMAQKRDQYTKLSDWIPGDQIRVIGKKNENTNTVDATILVNLSIAINTHIAANGWITNISSSTQEITYKWDNKEYKFKYDDNTRFVAGLKNPANVSDLKVGDRIRARLLKREGDTPMAKMVVVLRRGAGLFMKIRTFRPNATLVRLDSTIIPTTIQVRIDATPGLSANDVNNLIGGEGKLVTVNVTEDTNIVRKYFGKTTLAEFTVGDKLQIVGRFNDDGTIDAKLLKNNSIWKTNTGGRMGVISAIDVQNSFIMLDWTPIKYATMKQLKKKLDDASDSVTAQSISTSTKEGIDHNELKESLKNRIKTAIKTKVGKLTRNVQYKKVKINRIEAGDVTVEDLIEKKPVKKIKVNITPNTKIIVGTNANATISDLKIGDKIRGRGIAHAKLPSVTAEVIVVVNSLPEIEEPGSTEIDDINEVVSEIITDENGGTIVSDTTSSTEEAIDTEDSNDENGDSIDSDDDSNDDSSDDSADDSADTSDGSAPQQ